MPKLIIELLAHKYEIEYEYEITHRGSPGRGHYDPPVPAEFTVTVLGLSTNPSDYEISRMITLRDLELPDWLKRELERHLECHDDVHDLVREAVLEKGE